MKVKELKELLDRFDEDEYIYVEYDGVYQDVCDVDYYKLDTDWGANAKQNKVLAITH